VLGPSKRYQSYVGLSNVVENHTKCILGDDTHDECFNILLNVVLRVLDGEAQKFG